MAVSIAHTLHSVKGLIESPYELGGRVNPLKERTFLPPTQPIQQDSFSTAEAPQTYPYVAPRWTFTPRPSYTEGATVSHGGLPNAELSDSGAGGNRTPLLGVLPPRNHSAPSVQQSGITPDFLEQLEPPAHLG